jgi:hypothetical protein
MEVNTLTEADIQYLDTMSYFVIAGLISLIATIAYSWSRGGIREIIENVFLWFLLFAGAANLFTYNVDADDEVTAALYFIAFGACRFAKHAAKNNDTEY